MINYPYKIDMPERGPNAAEQLGHDEDLWPADEQASPELVEALSGRDVEVADGDELLDIESTEERRAELTESLDDVIEISLKLYDETMDDEDRAWYVDEINRLAEYTATLPLDLSIMNQMLKQAAAEMAAEPDRMMNIAHEHRRKLDHIVVDRAGGAAEYARSLVGTVTDKMQRIDSDPPQEVVAAIDLVTGKLVDASNDQDIDTLLEVIDDVADPFTIIPPQSKPSKTEPVMREGVRGASDTDTGRAKMDVVDLDADRIVKLSLPNIGKIRPLASVLAETARNRFLKTVPDTRKDDWLDDLDTTLDGMEVNDLLADTETWNEEAEEIVGADHTFATEADPTLGQRLAEDIIHTVGIYKSAGSKRPAFSEMRTIADQDPKTDHIETIHLTPEYHVLSKRIDDLLTITEREDGMRVLEKDPRLQALKEALLERQPTTKDEKHTLEVAAHFFKDIEAGRYKTLKMLQFEAREMMDGRVPSSNESRVDKKEHIQRVAAEQQEQRREYTKGRKQPFAERRERLLTALEPLVLQDPRGPEFSVYDALNKITPDRYRNALKTIQKTEKSFFRGLKATRSQYQDAKRLVEQVRELTRQASEITSSPARNEQRRRAVERPVQRKRDSKPQHPRISGFR